MFGGEHENGRRGAALTEAKTADGGVARGRRNRNCRVVESTIVVMTDDTVKRRLA